MKTFLICPVRGHEQGETESIVEKLESNGWRVHWPPRDTNQNDPTGFRICQDNRRAIADADAVHFIWNGESQGCLFDLGIAFALNKKIIPISMPAYTDSKSFQNMVREWSGLEE
jgi:nucleoside 2-deoxyribosyltransferase